MKNRNYYPNQYELLGTQVFVSHHHPDAGDDRPGTPEKPLKTLNAAAARLGRGDHVYVGAGSYREEVRLPICGHPYVPNSQIHFHA